jgi:hypothetical protein
MQHPDQNAFNMYREKLLVATSNQSYYKQQKQKAQCEVQHQKLMQQKKKGSCNTKHILVQQ